MTGPDTVEYGRPGLRVRVNLDDEHRFQMWLAQVDRFVEYVGVTRADLDDYPYRQAFDEGCGAAVVARQAIRASW